MKEIKKLKFYLPMLALTGSLALMQPLNVHAEEEEVLYEEQDDNYQQEDIDDSKVENTVTSAGSNVTPPTIQEATANNNDNQAINADKNYYFDNTNYYPGTDPSDNPGRYIPDSVQDEVDRKLTTPTTPTTPVIPVTPVTPVTPDTPDVPETPVPVPKMGMTLKDYNKKTLYVAGLGIISVALIKLLSDLRRILKAKKELKVVAKRDSKLLKRFKNNKKKELKK